MHKITIALMLGCVLVAGCAEPVASPTAVRGTGTEEFLKLRAGPGLGFKVLLGLPEGTQLSRHACVTEVGQLWCKVSLAKAPGMSGYVSADYLQGP